MGFVRIETEQRGGGLKEFEVVKSGEPEDKGLRPELVAVENYTPPLKRSGNLEEKFALGRIGMQPICVRLHK